MGSMVLPESRWSALGYRRQSSVMIPAEHSPAFRALFDLYNRRYLLPRAFRCINLYGSLEAGVDRQRPILYIANHSSWWDGLLLFHLWRRSGENHHYVMMDEQQLSKYRFFRKLGAYSVDKSSAGASRASLRYSEDLLLAGNRVWLFPQGDIRHLESRPLILQSGAAHLLRRVPQAAVVPVTFYYTQGLHSKSEVSLEVGRPLMEDWSVLDRSAIMAMLQDELQRQLDRHRDRAIQAVNHPKSVQPPDPDRVIEAVNHPKSVRPPDRELLRTGLSVNEKFDRVRRGRRPAH
ncbi:hypothetical protein B9G55_09750 [Saccharibacillus sp. O16]|nr:hypothetical protein B9G55_09750 [Saccharibacillus sp. O16]